MSKTNTLNVNNRKDDVYLTPKWILEPLGKFDLDPCASDIQPWPTAKNTYTRNDDGLLFLSKRVTFCQEDGKLHKWNAGAPSVLVAYGAHNAEVLYNSHLDGWYVPYAHKVGK